MSKRLIFVQVSIPIACFISTKQQFGLPSFHSAWHKNRNAVSLKKVCPLAFQQSNHSKYLKMCLCARMLVMEWIERAFIEKVNYRCFCWFPAAILVHQNGTPVWRLHTKLFKGAWDVSANNLETVGNKDPRPGQIFYISVFYNISFSWLLPQDGFQFIFVAWQWTRSIRFCETYTFFLYWTKTVPSRILVRYIEAIYLYIYTDKNRRLIFWV